MVERQPGRPSESGFIGAAIRFLGNEYEPTFVHVPNEMYANVLATFPGKSIDMDIIRLEQQCDGLIGQPESLKDFAVRQLATYQKFRKD